MSVSIEDVQAGQPREIIERAKEAVVKHRVLLEWWEEFGSDEKRAYAAVIRMLAGQQPAQKACRSKNRGSNAEVASTCEH